MCAHECVFVCREFCSAFSKTHTHTHRHTGLRSALCSVVARAHCNLSFVCLLLLLLLQINNNSKGRKTKERNRAPIKPAHRGFYGRLFSKPLPGAGGATVFFFCCIYCALAVQKAVKTACAHDETLGPRPMPRSSLPARARVSVCVWVCRRCVHMCRTNVSIWRTYGGRRVFVYFARRAQ